MAPPRRNFEKRHSSLSPVDACRTDVMRLIKTLRLDQLRVLLNDQDGRPLRKDALQKLVLKEVRAKFSSTPPTQLNQMAGLLREFGEFRWPLEYQPEVNVTLAENPFYEVVAVLDPIRRLGRQQPPSFEGEYKPWITVHKINTSVWPFNWNSIEDARSWPYQLVLRYCNVFGFGGGNVVSEGLVPNIRLEVDGAMCLNGDLDADGNTLNMKLPFNITPLVKKTDIEIQTSYFERYNVDLACTIQVVKKRRHEELIEILKKDRVRKGDTTVEDIKRKLMPHTDGILVFSERVSLLCPITKSLIKLPIRSTRCDHIQCFDAYNYLQMSEIRPAWKCPICWVSCEFNNLLVDELFQNLLADENRKDNTTVVFDIDGQFTFLNANVKKPKSEPNPENVHVNPSSTIKNKNIIEIVLDDDSDDENVNKGSNANQVVDVEICDDAPRNNNLMSSSTNRRTNSSSVADQMLMNAYFDAENADRLLEEISLSAPLEVPNPPQIFPLNLSTHADAHLPPFNSLLSLGTDNQPDSSDDVKIVYERQGNFEEIVIDD